MTSLSGAISLKKLILSLQKPSISNSVLARGGTLWVPRFSTLGFLSGLILWRTYASCCNHCELIGAIVLLWLFPCSPPPPLPLIIVRILYPWLSLRLGSKRSAMDAPLTAEHAQFLILCMLSSCYFLLILAPNFSVWVLCSVFFFNWMFSWIR